MLLRLGLVVEVEDWKVGQFSFQLCYHFPFRADPIKDIFVGYLGSAEKLKEHFPKCRDRQMH